MKYLKLRYIIPGLLIIVLIIGLCLFFIGGLKAVNYVYTDNIEFSEEGFEYVTDELLSQLEESDTVYNSTKKLITHNDKYALVIDYSTSVVTLVIKDQNWTETKFLSGKCFDSANMEDAASTKSEEKANVVLRYFAPNGNIMSTALDSYSGSVQYKNLQTGKTYRYYRIKALQEAVDGVNGVDILYQIGNFSNPDASFPAEFDRQTLVDTFIGNLVLNVTKYSDMKNNKIGDRYYYEYRGTGYTYNAECAAYLEEKGLATVKEAMSVFEINEPTPAGRWELSDLLDEEGRLKMVAGVDYNIPEGSDSTSPCALNPFSNNLIIDRLFNSSSNGYKLKEKESVDSENYNSFTNEYTSRSSQVAIRVAANTLPFQDLNNIMYNIDPISIDYNENGDPIYTEVKKLNRLSCSGNYFSIRNATEPEYDGMPLFYDANKDGVLSDDELVQVGGFQARDENGYWLYDENGKPVQQAFTLEQAAAQNEIFGTTATSSSSAYQIVLRVTIDENGMNVAVVNEGIEEETINASRYDEGTQQVVNQTINNLNKLFEVSVFPYFTATPDKEGTGEGEIILPDGSGAVISFNSVKDAQNAKTYSRHIYGNDATNPQQQRGMETETLMFGMYGFLDYTNEKGILAIVDKGASQTTINADFRRASNTAILYNYARFVTDLRERQMVSITNGSDFTKWSNALYQGDIVYKFQILEKDEMDYVGVANKYREYLVDKYDLDVNGDTTKTHVLSTYFIGAFEKKALTLGIVHDKNYSLTTFKQAEQIVTELENNGINDFNITYLSWTKDNMRPEITDDVKVSRVLGGEKDLISFSNYLKEKGYSFFPEYNVASGSGYDFAYGSLKYSPKSVGSTYSTVVQFVLSTGQIDAKGHGGGYISPKFYQSLAIRYLNKYIDLGTSGIALSNLGNQRAGDYANKSQIYTETGALYQQNTLSLFKENFEIQIENPFDYAFKYVTNATYIPLTTTLYAGVDYSIPLYQLVASGLFDYSGSCVNFNNENSPNWYLLKALETGSNLSYLLSAEDTNILLDTNCTEYYGAYYKNWKYNIIEMNKTLNATGIYESRLVNHEYISDNVVKVEYENGLTIIINFDNDIFNDTNTGVTVAANWFAILEEGI